MSHPRIVLNAIHFDKHGHAYPLDVADCVKPSAPDPILEPYFPPDVRSCMQPWPDSVPATKTAETLVPAESPESTANARPSGHAEPL